MEKISLKAEGIGVREFNFPHAEAILNLEAKLKVNHWAIAEPKKYEFSDGKINGRTSAKSNKNAEEQIDPE